MATNGKSADKYSEPTKIDVKGQKSPLVQKSPTFEEEQYTTTRPRNFSTRTGGSIAPSQGGYVKGKDRTQIL
eukprot:gene10508-19285_t